MFEYVHMSTSVYRDQKAADLLQLELSHPTRVLGIPLGFFKQQYMPLTTNQPLELF